MVLLTKDAVAAIEDIINRGYDAQVQKKGNGVIVYDVHRKIKYSTSRELARGKDN